jgi:hypothetical protein
MGEPGVEQRRLAQARLGVDHHQPVCQGLVGERA